MKNKSEKEDKSCSRREFFKIGGAVAAGLQVGAVAGAGLAAGKDPSTHTGWQLLGLSSGIENELVALALVSPLVHTASIPLIYRLYLYG